MEMTYNAEATVGCQHKYQLYIQALDNAIKTN